MSGSKEYSFYYANGFLYAGLMTALMVGWFFLAAQIEALFHRHLLRWPPLASPLMLFGGMAMIWWGLRFRLGRLYTRKGTGILHPDRFELRLPRKQTKIAFADVTHLSYREKRRGGGLILSAKGYSLYLEAPYAPIPGEAAGQQALKHFYQALKAALDRSRPGQSGEGESLSGGNTGEI